MSPQEAGDGLERMIEVQVQVKVHNQQEYEDKWQGWQNWTDEKLDTTSQVVAWHVARVWNWKMVAKATQANEV